MMKKCLSLLLVLAMLLSVCPMGVFADEQTPGAGENVTSGSPLTLVAIYDQGGARLIASGIGSAEVGEDVVPEGEGIIKTFLLDAKTLIPYSVSEEEYPFESTDVDETEDLDASEPTEETTEPTEATEETQEPTEDTEAPVEEPAEEPKEELTVEEAADNGYYVAPEGAQLEETANVEEMAAFSGKTVSKGEQTRTTTFSGLMPGELYFFAVSKSTGSPDSMEDVVSSENLVYADAKEALSDGTLTFENYQLTTGEAVIVQLYGYPNTKSIRFKGLDEDGEVDENGNTIQNLTLTMGETFDLGVAVEPAQWADQVVWSSSSPSRVSVEDSQETHNTITAELPGVAYVTATVTHGAYTLTTTCRVQVVDDAAKKLDHVELKDTSVTTELYRTEGTLISIFPRFNDLDVVSTFSAYNAEESASGHLIRSAYFGTDLDKDNKNYDKEQKNAETMNDLFTLEVVDDWTLRLVPTKTAVEAPKDVASKYAGKIVVEVEGQDPIVTEKALTVNVKKSTPKLTADNIQINSFYDTKSYEINVKGATVVGIEEADGKSLPEWLGIADNELTPNVDVQKSGSATIYLSVETEEWAIPAEVKVGVTMRYTAPSLRLSVKTVTLASTGSTGTTVQLLSQNKSTKLENMFIDGVTAGDQLSVEDYNLKTGKLVLTANGSLYNGTDYIEVSFQDATNTLRLPLQIKTVTPKLQLSKTSVSMNTKVGDVAEIKLSMNPSDAELPDGLDFYVTDSRNKKQDELDIPQLDDVELDGEYLIVRTSANQSYASAYRVHIIDGNNKDLAVLNVKPLSRNTNASVNLRTSGTLDLTYPGKGVTLTRTYRNMVSPEEEAFILKVNGKTVDNFEDYLAEGSDGKFYIAEDTPLKSGDKLAIKVQGLMDEEAVCTSNEVTFTVKRTPVNIRYAKSTVTLNKEMEEKATVTYTYTPSGDDVKKDALPAMVLTDNRGNETEALDVTVSKGKITVATNGDSAYGGVYKIYLRASKADKDAILTVKVATSTSSKVTYTTTASGTIDPTRDASKVTVKYTVRNFADTEPVVKITDATTGEDVTGLFDIVQNEKNLSQFFVTKKPASVLDTNHKYQVEADYAGREDLDDDSFITAKPAVLKVAAAKSTVKADRTVTIYRNDKNATYKFTVTSTDKKLNNVEDLSFKDSKQGSIYKIIPLGEGNFEIYVRDGSIEQVKAGNLTLNYYVRGMVHKDAKGKDLPNGTLSLKIAVK